METEGNYAIIVLHNGLSPARRQAINWSNNYLLFIEHREKYFSKIGIKLSKHPIRKMDLNILYKHSSMLR